MQRHGRAVGDRNFESCPTDVIRATPERVWGLLTNPARLGWLGVKVIEAPARDLAAGDRLRFGPAPGLRLSWTVLSIEPLRTLELDIKVPLGIRNHETVVVSPVGVDSCRVTFN
jgi:uncharacterized protein YndB with AHSA1/START domain